MQCNAQKLLASKETNYCLSYLSPSSSSSNQSLCVQESSPTNSMDNILLALKNHALALRKQLLNGIGDGIHEVLAIVELD